jgi:hypothetical protein
MTQNPDGSWSQTTTRSPNWIQRFQHWPMVWKIALAWSSLWALIWFAAMIYYNTGERATMAQYGIGNYSAYQGDSTAWFVISIMCVIGFGIAAWITRRK